MKEKKKSFILYDSDIACVHLLTTVQAGQLLQAIANLRTDGVSPDFGDDAALKILFHQITSHIAINEEKYQKICERNAAIARKRWSSKRSEDANAYESIPEDTKLYLNDNENENENENENDNDNDDVNVNGSFRSFSLNEAIKKPDFDISSVESFFRSAGAMANLKPHRDSSLS